MRPMSQFCLIALCRKVSERFRGAAREFNACATFHTFVIARNGQLADALSNQWRRETAG
jgi:hypothetical protein